MGLGGLWGGLWAFKGFRALGGFRGFRAFRGFSSAFRRAHGLPFGIAWKAKPPLDSLHLNPTHPYTLYTPKTLNPKP